MGSASRQYLACVLDSAGLCCGAEWLRAWPSICSQHIAQAVSADTGSLVQHYTVSHHSIAHCAVNSAGMAGDVNLFFNDAGNRSMAEIEV